MMVIVDGDGVNDDGDDDGDNDDNDGDGDGEDCPHRNQRAKSPLQTREINRWIQLQINVHKS